MNVVVLRASCRALGWNQQLQCDLRFTADLLSTSTATHTRAPRPSPPDTQPLASHHPQCLADQRLAAGTQRQGPCVYTVPAQCHPPNTATTLTATLSRPVPEPVAYRQPWHEPHTCRGRVPRHTPTRRANGARQVCSRPQATAAPRRSRLTPPPALTDPSPTANPNPSPALATRSNLQVLARASPGKPQGAPREHAFTPIAPLPLYPAAQPWPQPYPVGLSSYPSSRGRGEARA